MKTKRLALATLGAALALACSDSTNPMSGRGQQLTLSIQLAPGLAASVQGDSLIATGGGDTLVINSVELVLREIKLEGGDDEDACEEAPDSGTTSTIVMGGGDGHEHEHEGDDDDDECEAESTVGPTLVSVDVGSVTTVVTVPVDSGTFDEVRFRIHKPGNDPADSAFKTANPSWPANTSIRVTGRFNGVDFTFTTPLNAVQKVELDPPLTVNASGDNVDLTLRVDVSSWFGGPGGTLVDPATAGPGGANERLVRNNIKRSFRVFEDEDHDGHEDEGHGSHGSHGGDDDHGSN